MNYLPAAAGATATTASSAKATETAASRKSTTSATEASAKVTTEIGDATSATATARTEYQVHGKHDQDQEDDGMLLHPVAFPWSMVALLANIVFAFGCLHERLHAIEEALVILAFLKIRNNIIFADVFGLKIGNGAFQAVAHRNEELTLAFAAGGLYKDYHAIVVLAAADSPVVEDLR